MYVYVSNESGGAQEVFFDDFVVTVSESYIVQTVDYYAYGLVSRNQVRLGEKQTFDLFQGKTHEQLTGLYDFHARPYDAALGRFTGVEPQGQFASPYVGMGNNPVMGVDPDGEWVHIVIGAVVGGAINLGIKIAQGKVNSFGDGLAAFGIGAAAGAVGAATPGEQPS